MAEPFEQTNDTGRREWGHENNLKLTEQDPDAVRRVAQCALKNGIQVHINGIPFGAVRECHATDPMPSGIVQEQRSATKTDTKTHRSDCAVSNGPAVEVRECDCDQGAEFAEALRKAINSNSEENKSNTPDFILAAFLDDCLKAFNAATKWREEWHGRNEPYG